MKKILLYCFLVCGIHSVTYARDLPTKDNLQDKVQEKFKHDLRSFQEYSVLGKAQCVTKQFNLEEKPYSDEKINVSELYLNLSINIYNNRAPLLRLITEQSIKNSLVTYINTKQKILDDSEQRNSITHSPYYVAMQNCEQIFNTKNPDLYQAYLTLINNPENYIKPDHDYDDKDIQRMKNDYIKQYFIHVDIDGCPPDQAC